jgi:hypothetical protein
MNLFVAASNGSLKLQAVEVNLGRIGLIHFRNRVGSTDCSGRHETSSAQRVASPAAVDESVGRH